MQVSLAAIKAIDEVRAECTIVQDEAREIAQEEAAQMALQVSLALQGNIELRNNTRLAIWLLVSEWLISSSCPACSPVLSCIPYVSCSARWFGPMRSICEHYFGLCAQL